MSQNTFIGDDQLRFTVERSDDGDGSIILTITANGDRITINAGHSQDDAADLAARLGDLRSDAKSIADDWEDRPEKEDGYAFHSPDGWYARLDGKQYPEGRHGFALQDIAMYELAKAMAEAEYRPNTWHENERGITTMINDEILKYYDDAGQLKPLAGIRYEQGAIVSVAGDDWPTWVVDGDYGDMGVMIHTQGDPDISTLATHNQLTPYEEESES